jgi:hypothetical protein
MTAERKPHAEACDPESTYPFTTLDALVEDFLGEVAKRRKP